ncbi:MAG TPA: hypothetical protein VIU62_22010 [Chloroflexota bacterium]
MTRTLVTTERRRPASRAVRDEAAAAIQRLRAGAPSDDEVVVHADHTTGEYDIDAALARVKAQRWATEGLPIPKK